MAKGSREVVTRNDVAQYAGVSTAVVSYVVNDGPRAVSPRTRDRVLEAIRVLGYRPNAAARALKVGSTRTFGLVMPDGGNPLYAELAKAVEKEAATRGYVVLQTNTDSDPAVEKRKISDLLARQVDGLILATPTGEPGATELAELNDSGIPVVALNRPVRGTTSICPEYRAGARLGVEHLIGHGHERIGLVMGIERSAWSPERELGWRDALVAAGLPEGPIARAEFSRQGGYDAGRQLLTTTNPPMPVKQAKVAKLLKATERPTAIFVSSDLQAVGVLRALHEAGLDVPGEMAVVAFDGTAESEFSWPPLSVVRQPLEAVAQKAVSRLLDEVDEPVEAFTYPTELVLRASCGCN
ncbi:LacI family transcriptional regulator [Kribbella sp. NBC_01245]|uniref:LacI family DNA-binding transcriptional regulator n=1 Tax=Kribbella sp. NBC_01245 TaxID=2903578 RepID=UPI002E2C4BE5|nr:LacI family DNA-binding transcriptional regulator [Kribbella sp. NBC_01245]